MSDYRPPPPTTEERGSTKELLRENLRKEMLEEAAKLHRVIKGRTLGADVCLDKDEAAELMRKLESWAGRV